MERITGIVQRWDFWLCVVVATLGAALAPLDDPDLPMHLLTGEWMLKHGGVPTVEPFAWTRVGAPFYAYSWLPELWYALGWRTFGTWGVSLVHAAIAGASAWGIWVLARAQSWTVWSARIVAAVHILLWSQVQPAARPQLVLAVAVPLAWWSATWFSRNALAGATSQRTIPQPIVLVVALFSGALAANSHLLFPLTLAPVVVVLASPAAGRAWQWCAALVLGWVLNPNAAHLWSMFALNFAPNALFGGASPILEHESGFVYLTHASLGTQLLVLSLISLPMVTPIAARPTRERVWYGGAWLAGLVLFGLAVRGLLLWWLLALPWMAIACSAIPLPQSRRIARITLMAWVVVVVSSVWHATQSARRVADVTGLPHPFARDLAPLVQQLSCAVDSGDAATGIDASVRGVTNFDYGSYLAWRMPGISWSIDGRTIFPDSVARAESRQELRRGAPHHQPWHAAQVLVYATGHATLDAVRADSGWMSLTPQRERRVPVELWVRRDWWATRMATRVATQAPACAPRTEADLR